MSMSKKDFIALADKIKEYNNIAFWGTDKNGKEGNQNIPIQGDTLNLLADFCQAQNQNFKRERWLDYINGKCGKNGGKVKEDKPFTPAQIERSQGKDWNK